MKILIIARLFYPEFGGIQTYSHYLAEAFSSLGHEVLVLCPSTDGDRAFDQSVPYQVKRLKWARVKWIKTLAFVWATWKESRRWRPDLTVATIWAPCGLAAVLARLKLSHLKLGGKCLNVVHGSEIGVWCRRPFGYRLMKWVLERGDAVVTNSHFTANHLKRIGIGPQILQPLFCGVDTRRFHPNTPALLTSGRIPTNRLILLTCAALVKRKGIDMVLRAMPKVIEKVPQVLYRIGGKGADLARLQGLVRQLGLEKHVEFLGYVEESELPVHFAQCHFYIMPSRQIGDDYEGFGIVFLEANACGKPVIAGNSGGIPDAVNQNHAGILVEPNDVEELAHQIVRLCVDDSYYRFLANNARQHAEKFTWEKVAQGMLDLFFK